MRQQYDHITEVACVETSYYLPFPSKSEVACVETSYYLPFPSKFYEVYHNYLTNVKFIYYLPYLLCIVVFPRGLH